MRSVWAIVARLVGLAASGANLTLIVVLAAGVVVAVFLLDVRGIEPRHQAGPHAADLGRIAGITPCAGEGAPDTAGGVPPFFYGAPLAGEAPSVQLALHSTAALLALWQQMQPCPSAPGQRAASERANQLLIEPIAPLQLAMPRSLARVDTDPEVLPNGNRSKDTARAGDAPPAPPPESTGSVVAWARAPISGIMLGLVAIGLGIVLVTAVILASGYGLGSRLKDRAASAAVGRGDTEQEPASLPGGMRTASAGPDLLTMSRANGVARDASYDSVAVRPLPGVQPGHSDGRPSLELEARPSLAYQHHAALERALAGLPADSARLRQRMLMVVHEMSQSLSHIVLAAENGLHSREAFDTPYLRARLSAIARHATRLTRLLASVKPVGRLSDEDVGSFDPWDVLAAVCQLFSEQMASSGIQVSIYRNSTQAVELKGNADHIEQITANLISNGIEAVCAMDASRSRTIQIHYDVAETDVRLRICDNGPGVPADLEARLFEPFFSTKTHGLGVGLPISLDLAQRYGGTIAYGRVDGLTSFTLTLPQDPPGT